MVFFLAPVAVAGYMLYQKTKRNEEEQKEAADDDASKLAPETCEAEMFSTAQQSDPVAVASQQVTSIPEMSECSSGKALTAAQSSMEFGSESTAQEDQSLTISSSKTMEAKIQEKFHSVTDTWAKKFQTFCDDWEHEIAKAGSRNAFPQ
jgi:hypothetical protein